MQIHIVSGSGDGPTTLAAFDAALNDAGVANYNLLLLSSVIPPHSEIIVHSSPITHLLSGSWGDRLYVVCAQVRVDQPGQEAWAGVGWVQDPKTGKGLFVEHEGYDEASVRNDIQASLEALQSTRREVNFGPITTKIQGVTCVDKPVCALVIAVYQATGWDNQAYLMQKITS